jgi:hypothetical protein
MTWLFVRIALVLLCGVASLFVPVGPQAEPPMGWGAVLVILFVCPVVLVVVLAVQSINPRSAAQWRRPSWMLNPFNFREPLQFFHFAAYVLLAQGLATLVKVAVSPIPFYAEALVPLAMGMGIGGGIQLALLVFRSRVRDDR